MTNLQGLNQHDTDANNNKNDGDKKNDEQLPRQGWCGFQFMKLDVTQLK